ncbi:helix-turn-helix domain-containing protein [Nakamurella sp.]|uniref:helix-turn-helix domain-containing protein n=1 Tax=Nakamurella sp. TaxID=1869182 RepID=UPI00378472ED
MIEIPEQLRGRAVVDLWPTTGELLGMGRNQTYAAAKAGEIPTFRVGVRWKVPTAKLLDLLGLSDQTPAA